MVLYTGDTSPVCLSVDNHYLCPTSDPSIDVVCDQKRCPLEGSAVAPKVELKPTGALNVFSLD